MHEAEQCASQWTNETRGVVVADGLGVSKGLKHRVGLDNLLLNVALLAHKSHHVTQHLQQTLTGPEAPPVVMEAKYWITFLVDSVLPAPDSPVMRMDWFSRSWSMSWYAWSATAKMCGGFSMRRLPLYISMYWSV